MAINRIAICGFGHVGRFVYRSGINIFPTNPVSFELSEIITKKSFKSLTSIYKDVKSKYYPEKDYYKAGK